MYMCVCVCVRARVFQKNVKKNRNPNRSFLISFYFETARPHANPDLAEEVACTAQNLENEGHLPRNVLDPSTLQRHKKGNCGWRSRKLNDQKSKRSNVLRSTTISNTKKQHTIETIMSD